MRYHGYSDRHEPFDEWNDLPPALNLHTIDLRLFHQPDNALHPLLDTDLEAAEWKVSKDERSPGAPRHRSGMMHHLVEGNLGGRIVPERDLREGVADKDHVDAGGLGEQGGWVVVRGHDRYGGGGGGKTVELVDSDFGASS